MVTKEELFAKLSSGTGPYKFVNDSGMIIWLSSLSSDGSFSVQLQMNEDDPVKYDPVVFIGNAKSLSMNFGFVISWDQEGMGAAYAHSSTAYHAYLTLNGLLVSWVYSRDKRADLYSTAVKYGTSEFIYAAE